jgi:crotonobetainyl-CoA:carnitine CoA-transferase CaiB-like acyl-CoA transferase
MTADAAPLDGIVVVEASTYITAPFAGLMLAQLGARVIKIEPPRGDPFRTFSHRHRGLSAAWVNINQGKESHVLDLKSPGGASTLRALLADADVFIQNWRPGVARSLGLDPEDTVASFPRLIYLSISGFGTTGPRAGDPVFDSIIQAASGLASLESRLPQPATIRSYIADKTTAAYATQGILAALVARGRTGKGARIDLAMLDVMAHFNFPDLFQERTFLEADEHPVSAAAPSAVLPTLDGHVCIAPVQRGRFAAAATALGHPDWIPRLDAIESPRELIAELVRLAAGETSSRTTAECLSLFHAAEVPAINVATADDHLIDSQTLHNRLYDESTSPVGPIRRVRHPLLINGDALPAVGPPPSGPTRDRQPS